SRQFILGGFACLLSAGDDDVARRPRFRLFRMQTAFPSSPIGLDSDADVADGESAGGEALLNGVGKWEVALGNDNPFFDFQRPGDPGGVGYYKAYTQYQLYENDSIHCSFNLQAATPAGLEGEGVAGGPTILTPALAYFHE